MCRALAWIQNSKMSRVSEDLGQAVRLAPKEVAYHFVLGSVRLATGDDFGAIEAFNQALELSPDFQDAYAGRSLAWGRLGNLAKAAADAARAGDSAAARRLAERPASRSCIVSIGIKAEGTTFKYLMNWKNPVSNYASYASSDESADRSQDAQRSEEVDAVDRIRRAVGASRPPFGEPFASPAKAPTDSLPTFSEPVERVGYLGRGAHKPDAHYLEGLEPRVRQRADELNQRAWLLATSRYPSLRDGSVRSRRCAKHASSHTGTTPPALTRLLRPMQSAAISSRPTNIKRGRSSFGRPDFPVAARPNSDCNGIAIGNP